MSGDGPSGLREYPEAQAVMHAARVLASVITTSLDAVNRVVTVPQLRFLVVAATRGPLSLNELAQAVGVHASGATRACDRLVAEGLLLRSEATDDRRRLVLSVTDKGRELLGEIMNRRYEAIAAVLARMSPRQRRALAQAMEAFAEAAGETEDDGLWPVTPRM